ECAWHPITKRSAKNTNHPAFAQSVAVPQPTHVPAPQLHFFRLCTAWPLTLLAFVASCGTATFVVQQYDGAPLPKQRIAVVRLNGDQPLRLEELDGEKLGYELRDRG